MDDEEMGETSDPKGIVEAIQFLANEYDSLKTRLDALEDFFHNKFVGGLMQLVQDQDDAIGADDIKSKYGEMFSPYEQMHSMLAPKMGGKEGESIYLALYREVKDILDEPGRHNKLAEIAQAMADTKKRLLGEPEAPVSVETVSVETPGEEAAEPPEEEKDPLAGIVSEIQ